MTEAGSAAAVLLAVVLLACPSLPQGRDADVELSTAAPAAPLFPAGATDAVLVTRVYPNSARDDEFVEITNLASVPVDLSGWSLSDCEATATFPSGTRLEAQARLVATKNSTSYEEDVRRPADFTYGQGDARRMAGGTPRLADTGDEVLLLDASGTVRDAFVYGASTYAGPGWTGPPAPAPSRGEVATRIAAAEGAVDHDDAADWEGVRPYRLGQSEFDPQPLDVASVPRIFLSPEDGRGPLLSFLASADRTLEVAVYTLTSDAIGAVLADRARSGVRVRVLLEGAPVGGVDADEQNVVNDLLAAGADVRFLRSGPDLVKRYRYLHAKYAVVDGDAVVISSENFGDSGFPVPGDPGNRGWSAVVEDRALAEQLWQVFEEDFDPSRADSVAATPMGGGGVSSPGGTLPWSPAAIAGARRVRLVVGPDTALDADGWLGLLATARDRIWIEAFYADDPWGDRPNPLLEAAFAAARRGVSVRLLFDGSNWSSEAEVTGNGQLAAQLNERARRDGVDLEARVLAPKGSIERVHNKGMVVDGRAAFVSSLNWARGSATENREIGLVLEDPQVAARLEAAFLGDWEGRLPGSQDDLTIQDPWEIAAIYGFVAAACALSLRKMRRTNKGLKPRRGMVRRGLLRAHLRRRPGEVRVLSPELVAEPRDGPRGGGGDRGGGEETRGGLDGSPGDRAP
ncbi:MAG TPA: phospholipase D-like domain-containing protein [Thermoplasmata archaeon]|nr:phospholipase D-like domain-containing protein [Thermoplasmata archaeon]